MLVIQKGKPKKATTGSVQYATAKGSFYVRKEDLKAAGFAKAPTELFFIITDEQPEGYSESAENVEFEL